MKAIYKAPGEAPKIIDVENTLKALQEKVGGYIECRTFCHACVICNEDGRLLKMPFNINFLGTDFVGPILIVGVTIDEFTDYPADYLEVVTSCEDENTVYLGVGGMRYIFRNGEYAGWYRP